MVSAADLLADDERAEPVSSSFSRGAAEAVGGAVLGHVAEADERLKSRLDAPRS